MPIIKAKAQLVENVRSIVDNTKHHSVVLDLPEGKGGRGMGPTALELAIMALADCAVTIFADVAKNSNVALNKLEVTAKADLPPDSNVLKGVKLKVDVRGSAEERKMRAIWRRTEATCPVVKIFTDKISIDSELHIS